MRPARSVNSYNSDTPVAGARPRRSGRPWWCARAGRSGRAAVAAAGAADRRRAASRRTPASTASSGTCGTRPALTAPPGRYQARLTVGGDHDDAAVHRADRPALAAEGMTVADLKEQFDHNLRMRDMVADVGRVRQRIQGAHQPAAGAPPAPRRIRWRRSMRSRRSCRPSRCATGSRGSRRTSPTSHR